MSGFNRWLASQSICSLTGMFAGIVVGFVFGMASLVPTMPVLSMAAKIKLGLWLGLGAWVLALVGIGMIASYGVAAMAAPSLVTCLLTSVFTVVIDSAVRLPILDVIVGAIIGFMVGRLLCWVCQYPTEVRSG